METADAVIIGGGLIGTSIAFRLGSKLKKVILLEEKDIGGQTSGACDKAVFLQSKQPGYPIRLAKASREIYEHLEEELDYPFEFKQSGGMVVIESEAHLPFMKDFVERQATAGIEVELLDKKATLEHQPNLANHMVGATYSKEDAEVNPLLLTQAFAYGARREGVDIRTGTKVVQIHQENGEITGVTTTNGRIATDLVIHAAGPFANELMEPLDVSLPIKPRRGVILITEKSAPLVRGSMLCSQYIMAKHLTGDNTSAPPYGIGMSLGQTESGNLLIGGSREFVGFDRDVKTDIMTEIARHATRIVPALKNRRLIRTMTGFRPYTGDGLPIIDRVANVDGLILAVGHEGDGIALAPITGKLVADLVEGKQNPLLAPLSLERFSTKHTRSVLR